MESFRTNTYFEIMITTDAIKRLSYTISKGHKPNETDKLALNSIINFINKTDEEVFQEHGLFAKLYIFVLKGFLVHYNYDIDFASKQLHRELMTPLNCHIEEITNYLKAGEMSRFFEEKGIISSYYRGKNFEEQEEFNKRNKELLDSVDGREFLEAAEWWNIDSVSAQLQRQINEAIINYKND